MKVNVLVNKNNDVIGYQKYPLNLAQPVIELEEFPSDLVVGKYKYENNKIVKKTEYHTNTINSPTLNYSKEKLIKAFTEYRNNVNYGLIIEEAVTHQEMIRWYKAINNDDVDSINNPPKNILKYLENDSWT